MPDRIRCTITPGPSRLRLESQLFTLRTNPPAVFDQAALEPAVRELTADEVAQLRADGYELAEESAIKVSEPRPPKRAPASSPAAAEPPPA